MEDIEDIIEYTNILILEYLYKNKGNYILSELMKKLGMDYKSFNDFISDMINNELLEYNNSLLRITKKGTNKIINFTDNIYDNNFIMNDINNFSYKENKHDIYVPINFLKKI